MTNKPSIAFSEEEDEFGFTVVDGESITEQSIQPVRETNEQLSSQLQQMYNAIMTLLKNLNSNPEKDYIHWPNRQTKIAAFKEKIDKIGGDNIKRKVL